jgi:ribosomal protein L11 methylase PrmA
VSDRVVAEARSLDGAPGPFDLALVNVTAAVHADVGPGVTARTAVGGRLLLAGLLPGQWRHVAGAYAGTRTVGLLSLEGWEGLELAV